MGLSGAVVLSCRLFPDSAQRSQRLLIYLDVVPSFHTRERYKIPTKDTTTCMSVHRPDGWLIIASQLVQSSGTVGSILPEKGLLRSGIVQELIGLTTEAAM